MIVNGNGKRTADTSIIPIRRVFTPDDVEQASNRFTRPYHFHYIDWCQGCDPGMVYAELVSDVNREFLWELLQWQLMGMFEVNDLIELDRDPTHDNKVRYGVWLAQSQPETGIDNG